MAHQVQAFVGTRPILELIQRQYELSRVIELEQRIAMLPLLDELYDAVPGDLLAPSEKKFVMLSPKIVGLLKEISTYGIIGYFETNYSGGAGDQGAVLAKLGEITFGPQVGPGSINQMLDLLGVSRKGPRDEFDALGLGRFRDNKSWIEKPLVRQTAETTTLTGSLISWIHGLGKK